MACYGTPCCCHSCVFSRDFVYDIDLLFVSSSPNSWRINSHFPSPPCRAPRFSTDRTVARRHSSKGVNSSGKRQLLARRAKGKGVPGPD